MHKTRILIVEDEAIVAEDIRQQMVNLGYEPVACTARGEDAIITLGADLRIGFYNSAAGCIFGITAEEMLGREVDVLISPEYGDRHRRGVQRYLETGQPTIMGKVVELQGQHKDGSVFPLEMALSEARVGNERAFTAIIRDITKRNRAEQALRQQAEELRARNEELTRFNRVATGRELRAIELKQQFNDLAAQLGQPRPYALAFLDAAAAEVIRTTPKPSDQGSEVRRSHRSTERAVTMKEKDGTQNHDLAKAPTGIQGLDELTSGGLPKGRPTLLCGSAGCGKTLVAMEFLVRGATEFGEPGVFMAFEERTEELAINFASLGHDLNALVAQKKLVLSFVHIERSEIEETGEYDLEGLFIRLGHAIDSIGAQRVVLDTIEALFSGLSNTAILRAELRRLFRWLKEKGVTAVITGERGENSLTRYGLEEYVADCVILLDHRTTGNMATRRLRVVKYRGSTHGTSEYPFLIDEGGISILPITSMGLKHMAGTERVSSGVARLDAMMGGKGYYRGSSVLVSGTAGSGKTSLAAHFAATAATRGERCLWFAFEESSSQIIRNMRSIGVDLEAAVTQGFLRFHAERPTMSGLELHLVTIHKLVNEFKPRVVIIDPITNFNSLGNEAEIKAMLVRLIDFFKMQQITALFTSLTSSSSFEESTEIGVSSLMDTWLQLRDLESGAERNRGLHLLKSRGMAHSNQVREFLLTDHGVELRDVYLGPSGALLTGSARDALEAQEKAQGVVRDQQTEGKRRELERKRQTMEARIGVLRAEYGVEEAEILKGIEQDKALAGALVGDRVQMGEQRQADAAATPTTQKLN